MAPGVSTARIGHKGYRSVNQIGKWDTALKNMDNTGSSKSERSESR